MRYTIVSNWKKYDRRYGWRWRAANGLAALLIVSSIALPVLSEIRKHQAYQLSAATLGLIGPTTGTLANKLQYNPKSQVYEFNKEVVAADNPLSQLKAQVGGNSDKSKQLYALDVHEDMSKGVTFYDTNSQLNFSMIPQFKALPGKIEQGHLVFPLGGGPQAIYTLKNNGLKEDIVVQQATADTMRFSYKLELPSTLEARALPDNSGGIGIYAANPNLYSNMSYGSDKDRELVEKARSNAEKDSLVFGLPAPVITKAAGDADKQVKSRFELQDNTLTVIAEGLSNLTQPFSIDPSVVVTSTSDFQTGHNEGNIAFDSGSINRNTLTGGSLGQWHFTDNSADRGTTQNGGSGAANGMIQGRNLHMTVAYNGYVYVLGGSTVSGTTSSVERAPINSNGTLGTWVSNGTLFGGENRVAAVATVYNGYVYYSGGEVGNNPQTSVRYAPIDTSTGAIGTWQATTAMPVARSRHAMVAYASKMYIINGCTVASNCNASSPTPVVYCADINPDGSIAAAWTSCNTTNLTGRDWFGATAYNGYLYIAGGCQTYSLGACNNAPTTITYAQIKSDGSLGDWQTTSTSFTSGGGTARKLVAHNGYLYLTGSNQNNYTTYVEYAPIYANGQVGTWSTTSSFSVARSSHDVVVYGNYLYIVGGCTNWSLSCNTVRNDVQYAAINSAGVLAGQYTTETDTIESDGIMAGATVAHNGYLYILGGTNTTSLGGQVNTVYYAQLNEDGSTGAWGTTSAFSQARIGAAAVAYGGYMYLLGGWHTSTDTACHQTPSQECGDVQKAVINSNGTLGAWTGAGTGGAATYFSSIGRNTVGAAAYAGKLYAFGGSYNNNTSVSAETTVGNIQSDGTVTGWTTTGNMATAKANFATAQYGPYLYVIAGRANSNQVQYAILNSSGTVTWSNTSTITNGREAPTAGVSNGYVYVMGGNFGGGVSNYADTQYARICQTTDMVDGCNGTIGTLGTWRATSSFTTARAGHMGAIYNGYAYVMGGCSNWGLFGNCSGPNAFWNDLQYARINNGGNGSTATWASAGTGFTNARYLHATVAYNNFLYVAGGTCGGGSACNTDIQYAPINTNGTIGSWGTDTDANANSQSIASMLAYKGYMYITTTGGGGNHSVQYALICTGSNNGVDGCGASAGSVGTWHLTTDFTAGQRIRHNFGVYNDRLYIFGGYNGSANMDDVLYASINSDGTIGSWTTQSGGLPAIHDSITLQMAINSNYVYAIDGTTGQVRSAPINSNGSIGSWTIVSTLPGTGNVSASYAYVANGYLYFLEGGNDGLFRNIVLYAAISPNGTLGPWVKSPNTFSTARNLPSGVFYNGNLYITGGCSGVLFFTCTAYQNDVQYAGQNAIPRKGLYSKLIDFGYNSVLRGISYGSPTALPDGSRAISFKYGTSASSAYTGTSTAANTSLANARCAGISGIRYLMMSITMDDSQRAIFPDDQGSPAQLDDITLQYEYVRPPNERLRMGQTLKNGTLSELDICKLQS